MKCDFKQRGAYVSATFAFIAGWGLTIAGFIVEPLGEVSGSVLAVLGEAMVYAASVFGVTLYFNHQMEKFRSDTRKYINKLEEDKGNENLD